MLDGQWLPQLMSYGVLFALKQALNLYDSYQCLMGECDEQRACMLGKLAAHDAPPADPPNSGRDRPVKAPKFDLRPALYRTCGVDLTCIDGIGVGTALKMFAAVGPGLSHFKSVKHFASWLGPCPGTAIYTLMTKGQAYVGRGQNDYEQQHQQRVVKNLKSKIQQMGFALMPIDAVRA